MLARLLAAYDRVLTATGFLCGAVFVVLAVLISLDVLLRNIGVYSSAWLLEVTEYALFATTFLAAPWVLRLASHVRVDLVVSLVPAAVARRLELSADAAGFVCALLLARHGWRIALDAFVRGDLIVKELIVPEWWLLAVIPVSGTMMAIEFARRFAATARGRMPQPGGGIAEGF